MLAATTIGSLKFGFLLTPGGFGSLRKLDLVSSHSVDQVSDTPGVSTMQTGFQGLAIPRVVLQHLITKFGKISLQNLVRGF
jgi:hypothetical protein